MAYGKLGLSIPAANTNTVIYTVPSNCIYAELTINILNPDSADITVDVALASSSSPASNEYIEKGTIIPASGGILERTNLICSPGENVVVKSSLATSVVRVSGKELAYIG